MLRPERPYKPAPGIMTVLVFTLITAACAVLVYKTALGAEAMKPKPPAPVKKNLVQEVEEKADKLIVYIRGHVLPRPKEIRLGPNVNVRLAGDEHHVTAICPPPEGKPKKK